jgi:nucleoside-diphosphate-sugar epimerase
VYVLVTGAAGRIGSHLTRLLVDTGHQVRAFVLPGDPRADLIRAPGVEIVPGTLQDDHSITAAVADVDAVYHLAGALTSRGNTDQEFFELNVGGTFTLLMAARSMGPRMQRFVYASSDAVYLPGPGCAPCYLPIDEAHPRLAATVYAASKAAAEDLCFSFWRAFGVPVTVLRFGATADAVELTTPDSVFARWLFLRAALAQLEKTATDNPDVVESILILRALDDGQDHPVIFADRDGTPEVRQWADARDIADGCVRALAVPAAVGEVFNLGGVAPFGADQLASYLGRRLGLAPVTARLPIARSPWYISSAKARAMLGYEPDRTVFDMVDDATQAAPPRIR